MRKRVVQCLTVLALTVLLGVVSVPCMKEWEAQKQREAIQEMTEEELAEFSAELAALSDEELDEIVIKPSEVDIVIW